MADLKTNVEMLNQMILDGKILQAFDQFYAEEITMQDNNNPARMGKAENRSTLISDALAVTEWWFDYTHKDYGERNYKQLAVQRWKDGQLIEEKFYYNN